MAVQPTSHEPRRLHRGGGFSLIELVAVMAIVGILAAVAAVSLGATTSNRSTMAAKQLLRDLTFARQRAVATGTRTWVTFDAGDETWTVLAEDPANPGRANASVLTDPATSEPFVQTLGADQFVGVQVQAVNFDGDEEVGFDWLGQPLNGEETPLVAPGSATLTGNHTVTVEPDTGHIAYVSP